MPTREEYEASLRTLAKAFPEAETDSHAEYKALEAKGIYNGAIWQGRHFTRFLIQYLDGNEFVLLVFSESMQRGWNNFGVQHELGKFRFTQAEVLEIMEMYGAKQLRETVGLVPRWDTYEEDQAKIASGEFAARESRRRAWLEAKLEEILHTEYVDSLEGTDKAIDLLREACEAYQNLD